MIKIRKGKKSDLPDILSLIKELAEYENSANQVSITLEQLENDGFSKKPSYYFLIAEKSNEIIGMSFYWIRYSTWKGKFLFLEEYHIFLSTLDVLNILKPIKFFDIVFLLI